MPQGRIGIRKPVVPQFPGRGLVELLTGPLDEPQMPLPGAAGVTTFLKGGVPDVIGRQAATRQSLRRLLNLIGYGETPLQPNQVAEVMRTARRYPRVLAHVEDFSKRTEPGLPKTTTGFTTSGSTAGRSRVYIDPEIPQHQIANTLTHELGHVAQEVGQKDAFRPLYSIAHDQFGYVANPYEVSARAIAQSRFPSPESPFSNKASSVVKRLFGSMSPDEVVRYIDALNPTPNITTQGRVYRFLSGTKR